MHDQTEDDLEPPVEAEHRTLRIAFWIHQHNLVTVQVGVMVPMRFAVGLGLGLG